MNIFGGDIHALGGWYNGPGPAWPGGTLPSLDDSGISVPEDFISVQEVEDFVATNHTEDITAIEQDSVALLGAEVEAQRLAAYLRSEISALRSRLRDARTQLYSIDRRLHVLGQARFSRGRCLITDLPTEVLDRVVGFLEVDEYNHYPRHFRSVFPPWRILWIDVKGLASSCRTLREQCWHHMFRFIWLHRMHPYPPSPPSPGPAPSLSRSAKLLRTLDSHPKIFDVLRFLDLSGEAGIPSDVRLLQGCTNLQGLVVGSWMHVTHAPPSLRELYLRDVSPNSLVDALPRLRQLRHLDLGKCESSHSLPFQWFFCDPYLEGILHESRLESAHFSLSPAKIHLGPRMLATVGQYVHSISLGFTEWFGDIADIEQLLPLNEQLLTCRASTFVLSPNNWGDARFVLRLLERGLARQLLSIRRLHIAGFRASLGQDLPEALFSAVPAGIDEFAFRFGPNERIPPSTGPGSLVHSLLRGLGVHTPAPQRIARRVEVWALPADHIEEHLSDLAMGCAAQGLGYQRHHARKEIEGPRIAFPRSVDDVIKIFWEDEE